MAKLTWITDEDGSTTAEVEGVGIYRVARIKRRSKRVVATLNGNAIGTYPVRVDAYDVIDRLEDARTAMKQPATPEELIAIDHISRALSPDAWAEFDDGNGVCTISAGENCIESIKAAQRLIRAYPAIVPVIASKR
jgi:hypothetical protein